MLQAPVQPLSYSLRERRKSNRSPDEDVSPSHPMTDVYDDDDDEVGSGSGGKIRSKSRRELPAGAVATLKAWLLSPEHFSHPYPTPQDQAMLMQKTGIDKKQLKNWFTNARRRIWKPMLKKQLESGQLTAAGAGVPGAMSGLMMPAMPGGTANSALDNPHSVQAIRVHYQQAVQQQQQEQLAASQEQQQAVPLDSYGNPIYPPPGSTGADQLGQSLGSQYYTSEGQQQMLSVNSLGTLPRQSSGAQLSKTDSHAVLMELFARDQDLVRQAAESARLKAEAKQQPPSSVQAQPPQAQHPGAPGVSSQHPMKGPTQSSLQTVPTMNSWPHFSSITSLNNLGTIPGVKSITSLSGADLASKGNVNKMGNLAQVKSFESMGKNDSYAFLEVFFGDKSSGSSANLTSFGSSGGLKGKMAGEEDNEIGLSLEDESPSHTVKKESSAPPPVSAAPQPAPLTTIGQDAPLESGTLKRAYDDALAARGLMSVSRSSEKLTDLVLPAKIQRTLSQELINKEQLQKQGQSKPAVVAPYSYTSPTPPAVNSSQSGNSATTHQYPGQHTANTDDSYAPDSSDTGGHVEVPTTTTCAICSQTNVDTQLRPCGHMFHERCLKPSLQTPRGPPKCPVDGIPMHSAVLAIPTDDTTQQPAAWNCTSSPSVPAADK